MKFSPLPLIGRLAVLAFFLSIPFSSLHAADEKTQAKAPAASPTPSPIQDIFSKDESKVDAIGDELEYQKEKKLIIARGNAMIRHENLHITADYAELETETKKVHAKGHVIIFKGDDPIAKGDEIFYDFANKSGHFPDGRALSYPWFIKGQSVNQVKEGVKVIHQGSVSTCDLENPHYEIRAKKVTMYEGDKMIARNVKFYILNRPIFWWPYLIIPLRDTRNALFAARAGHTSRHGYFLEISKGMSINQNIGATAHIDWRSKRGVGGGLDFDYHFMENKTQGFIKTYLTQDKKAPTPRSPDPYSDLRDHPRGRVTWVNRSDFDPDTHMILRYNRVEDEYFLQDFFQKESQVEVDPQSFVTLTKNTEKIGLLGHFEKRANHFESTLERMPQLQFDWKTQPLYKQVFYENQFSYNYLNTTFGRGDKNENTNRYDGFHEFTLPLQWNNIKLTPFADFRTTYYTRERESDQDQFRVVFAEGADLRTQAYKTYPATFDKLGIEINHLRHVLEPYVQAKTQTSTVSDEKLQEFDSIDRIDDAGIVTLGVENRLQTKRVVGGRMQRVDVVSLNTYLSYEIHPDGRSLGSQNYAPFNDGQTASNFTIYGQEVVLRPYQWLQYEVRFDYGFPQGELRTFNQDILFRKGPFRVIVGHRYNQDIEDSEGSNQFVFDGKWMINPLWALGGYFRWDTQIDGREEWQLSATRDLHDFILEFGYNVRNSSIENNNRTIFFDLRMKAFPIINFHGAGNRSSFSEPRIGETVAGSTPATDLSDLGNFESLQRYQGVKSPDKPGLSS